MFSGSMFNKVTCGVSLLPACILFFILNYFNTSFIVNISICIGFYLLFLFLIVWLLLFWMKNVVDKKVKNILLSLQELTDETPSNIPPLDALNDQITTWTSKKKVEIEQLKRLESYRKEFLENVSHELKTPIFNIQGYLHTLLDGALDESEVREKFVRKATKNADRLSTLVDDLLIISSLETKNLTLEKEEFNIAELIKEAFEALEIKSKEKNIGLEFKKGCDKSFIVNADKDRIKQVVYNLIDNSIKYGKEGGKTSIGCYDMENAVSVEISDNGIGIEEELLPRLFERFYRVDKSRSREAGGTGLGLSIVKHILEAHQSQVNVTSSIGIGTTFSFNLQKN